MSRPAIIPSVPCNLAVECATSIANYCSTRFPCDTPPHPMLDVPYFTEKVQRCIDEACQEIAALNQRISKLKEGLRQSVGHCDYDARKDIADRLKAWEPER